MKFAIISMFVILSFTSSGRVLADSTERSLLTDINNIEDGQVVEEVLRIFVDAVCKC